MDMILKNLSTIIVLGCWFVANVTTVILNKFIFQTYGFTYPLLLTVTHMVVCTIGSYLILRVIRPSMFIHIDWNEYKNGVLPLAALFCANIVLGNISIRWVPVSFMQTIKSSVPFFTVVIEQVVFNTPPADKRIWVSLIPIVGGVMLATYTEVNFEIKGFMAAMIASVIHAGMTAVSSRLMRAKLDSVNLTYYMAPPSALMTLPFMLTFEYSNLTSRWAANFAGTNIVFVLLLSGAIALALNVSTFLAIKATSALTFTVIGNIKVIFSIVISVIIFQNEIGLFNAFGCAVTIAGAWWYSQIQYEVKTRKQQTPELPVTTPSDVADRK
eukprot:TRINITY_DN4397_c0_g1_i1.p1 TRINITY_DN4397_c0_g1~~TRINITY_DN4397_c0_g1_i1.p1  ORF type:complete len:327 (+),score=58.55 TRINITY_DN4397_c0_g1_i1:124-1104(+)